jgi:hypothetical protein
MPQFSRRGCVNNGFMRTDSNWKSTLALIMTVYQVNIYYFQSLFFKWTWASLPTDPESFSKTERKPTYSDRVYVQAYSVENYWDQRDWILRIIDFTSLSLHYFAVNFTHSDFIPGGTEFNSHYFNYSRVIVKRNTPWLVEHSIQLTATVLQEAPAQVCQSRSERNTAPYSQRALCLIH